MRTLSAAWQSTYWNTLRLSSSYCVHLIAFLVNLTLVVSVTFAKTLTERLKTRWHQRFENMFFFVCLFSDVKRRISLVLKVTAKMYLICFQVKDKAEDSWRHSFLGGHVAIIWTSSDCHATLLLSGTDSYKPYGFFLDPFTHYHFVCCLHIYVQFI